MVSRQSTCLRRLAGGRRGGIVGFSRFLANPRVSVAALVAGWGTQIAAACAGRHVLAIQDTSEFNFATSRQRDRGLGEIGKGGGRGLLLHAMLGMAAYTSHLEHLLRAPETQTLLATAPPEALKSLGRTLRPIARLLGVDLSKELFLFPCPPRGEPEGRASRSPKLPPLLPLHPQRRPRDYPFLRFAPKTKPA